jgi:hypothetical protein
MKQAEATTQKAYPEKPEQPPGTQRTQCQGREIFASNSAKRKYERKSPKNEKSTKKGNTHIFRKNCWLMGSTHRRYLLQMF